MDHSESPSPDDSAVASINDATSASDAVDASGGGSNVFDVDRLRQIIELMEQHQLSEIDLQQGADRIKLGRGSLAAVSVAAPATPTAPPPAPAVASPPPAAAPSAPAASADTAGTITIDSPMVGTFYGKANPDSPPFVKVGDTISEDTTVCIIEAMKVFNEIPAEIRGEVVEILATDGQSVDFGRPLFRVRTAG